VDEQFIAVLGRDKRLAEVMNMLELIAEPCGIVKVGQRCWPEFLRLEVENGNRLARRTEQHFLPAHRQIVPRVGCIQRILCRGFCDQVINKRTWKSEAIVLAEHAVTRQGVMQDLRNRVTDADLFKYVQRRRVNALNVGVAKWLVSSPLEARTYG
jgi:hypothetical protein